MRKLFFLISLKCLMLFNVQKIPLHSLHTQFLLHLYQWRQSNLYFGNSGVSAFAGDNTDLEIPNQE